MSSTSQPIREYPPPAAFPQPAAPSAPDRRGGTSARQRLAARIRRDRILLVLVAPGILLLLLFRYVPLLGNLIAFQDFQPFLGIWHSEWIGLTNFATLTQPAFINALKNTIVITLIQVILVFPLPILVAILLNSLLSEGLKRVVQSVLYLPHFLSWVMVVAITQQFLGGTGIVNTGLRSAGLHPLEIVGNQHWFLALVTSQVVWKDTGWATILFLAALSRIDIGLYEAASVDGASRWRQTWHITLPGLKSIIVLLLILRLGEALNVGFEQILLQQTAVGVHASEVLDTYVYNNGIIGGNWGPSAVVGLLKGVVGIMLVVGANRVAHAFGEPGLYQGDGSH